MARQSKREARAAQRRQEYAVKLMLLGAAFIVLPLFLGNSPFGKAFGALMPIGLLLFAIGGGALAMGGGSKSPDLPKLDPRTGAMEREPLQRSAPVLPERSAPVKRGERLEPEAARAIEPAKRSRPQTWSKAVFGVIEWRRFEAVVERLFQQAGFETKSQSHGADGGVDVWLHSRHQPEGPVSLVQCKHWQGKRVGVDKIRELRGVMAAKNVRRGQFATTSSFTPDAIAFAKDNGINLLDVDALLGLIGKRTPDEQADLLAVALEGEYWRPTCVNCGIKMVERSSRQGGAPFWGCSNYPKCKTTMQVRAG